MKPLKKEDVINDYIIAKENVKSAYDWAMKRMLDEINFLEDRLKEKSQEHCNEREYRMRIRQTNYDINVIKKAMGDALE